MMQKLLAEVCILLQSPILVLKTLYVGAEQVLDRYRCPLQRMCFLKYEYNPGNTCQYSYYTIFMKESGDWVL